MSTAAPGTGSGAGYTVLGFAILIGGVLLYILPSLIASRRRLPELTQVVIVNIFLGWTFIGWIVALVMANKPVQPRYPQYPPPPVPPQQGYGRWPGQ